MSEPVASAEASSPSALLRGSAREHDPDRYLSALLAPKEACADLVVIAAYLGEIKRIPLIARDAAIGEIRMQWWRDVLEGDAGPGKQTGHPVADALTDLARRGGLSRELLLAPLDGYGRELYEDGISDDAAFGRYAEETEGAAIRLACSVLGRPGDERLTGEASLALASTRLALTLPQHVAHGRLPLSAGIREMAPDPRGEARIAASGAVSVLTGHLADTALAARDRFQAGQGRLPRACFPAFLPLALVGAYAKALSRPGRDALLEIADISPLSRVSRLWFAHWRRRV